MILGSLFIFGNWPHTKTVEDYSSWDGPTTTLKHTGNAFWLGVGFIMAGIGQLFLLVGLIGQGVKFGTRAA